MFVSFDPEVNSGLCEMDISEITGLDTWGHLLSSVPGAIFPAPTFLSCGLHCLRGHLPVAESTEESGEEGDVESSG